MASMSPMTPSATAIDAVKPPAALRSGPGLRLFMAVLGALLLAMLVGRKVQLTGDVGEYVAMTVAVASHGSADIRPDDIDRAAELMPFVKEPLMATKAGILAGQEVPQPGFYRGNDGKTYAIHFYAYSAMAAVPFKLLQKAGLPALKAYQVVNLAMVFVLGLALFRLFNNGWRALAGVTLYMLCGGILYWTWSSPECLSAAALLAGFAYFSSQAPLRGGLLIGIAALQNPSIVFTLGAMPLLTGALHYQPQIGLFANARATLRPRMLAGLMLGGALFALPPLFNLQKFGVPSIIAKVGTAKELISPIRLHSLFFDLNQGMIIAVPAVAAALLLWGWRAATPLQRRQRLFTLALCALLAVAYAVPAMMVHNWNSGAAGVMRYAFWCAMPFVFLLLWRLREAARWPVVMLSVLAIVQLLAMVAASRYNALQFSQVAQAVMRYAPNWYNPEPEIFAERSDGAENYLDPKRVYTYKLDDVAVKTMVSSDNPDPGATLCGAGKTMSGGKRQDSERSWIYLNGPVRCVQQVNLGLDQYQAAPVVMQGRGWSTVERSDGHPPGQWSEGDASTLLVAWPQAGAYSQITFKGNYFDGNTRTRVTINGVDTGWHKLAAGEAVAIPDAEHVNSINVELRHEAPRSPGPHDGRKLAFFTTGVSLN